MQQIDSTEIMARLAADNPWWDACHVVDARIGAMPRRAYFPAFLRLVAESEARRAVILMGPRRVGKTIMIHQLIQHLIAAGSDPRRVAYASLDTPIYTGLSLSQITGMVMERTGATRDDRLFLFFDEVPYARDWERHLKSLVDTYPSFRFVASGSSAAALKLKSDESGAGRFTDFLLPPLTFAEFLRFLGIEDTLFEDNEKPRGDGLDEYYWPRDVVELNQYFIDYLNYGGFPEAVMIPEIRENAERFLGRDIIDKVLLKDIPSLYGITDIQEMNALFTTLAYNTGNIVSLEELSKTASVAKNTLKKYLEYLEAAFLILRIRRIDDKAKRFKREVMFKVYLTNPAMRAALFGPASADDDAMGHIVETAVFSQWLHSPAIDSVRFARWKGGEVDMVYLDRREGKPSWACEIKWSDRFVARPRELSPLLTLARNNPSLAHAIATTRTGSADDIVDGLRIVQVPCSVLCYTIGRNVVDPRFFRGFPPRLSVS